MTDQVNDPLKTRLLDAILPHVVFDGWGPESFAMACADIEVPEAGARAAFPRGAVELAVAYHKRGDAQMIAALAALPMDSMRIREKVAAAIMARLIAVGDKELVRRGTALFALPQYAGDGAALIWGTADAIWTTLGDTSEDGNWYSKRTVLSAVYTATVLFWLGDHSADDADTRAFLDRRIENVMQFEKFKAAAGKLPVIGKLFENAMAAIKAPGAATRDDLPGTPHNRT